ncbi:MAG: hypothetical protein U9O94_09735 [Nanoarchaeota archaeon]|nr:hypothetical protein [Nanoarchaeota archaeon]
MVSQHETINHLNKEKDYEDGLAEKLTHYFIHCLDDISVLTKEEKEKIDTNLTIIMHESMKHSVMFAELIQTVVMNGEDDY